MKSSFLLVAALAVPATHAQMRDNRDKEMTCNEQRYGGRRAFHCDVREQTVSTAGHLNVDAGKNGGVTVKGWLRNDVLVRSRVEAWADRDADAQALAGQVVVDAGSGQVAARARIPPIMRAGRSVTKSSFRKRPTSSSPQRMAPSMCPTFAAGLSSIPRTVRFA